MISLVLGLQSFESQSKYNIFIYNRVADLNKKIDECFTDLVDPPKPVTKKGQKNTGQKPIKGDNKDDKDEMKYKALEKIEKIKTRSLN